MVPRQDKEAYKLYEQRDKIAIMAMKNELDQESKEYRYVINYINFWIYYTRNDYDFSIVWNNIVSSDLDLDRKIDKLDSKVQDSVPLNEARKIAAIQSKKSLGIRGFVFEKIFLNGVIFSLKTILYFLKFGDGIIVFGRGFSEKIKVYLNDSRRIKRDYRDLSDQMTYRI